MAVSITIDAVIRRYLAMSRLPLHYYVPMLVFARRGLKEMHYDSLGKVKHVTLTVDAANEAELPVDYIDSVVIGINVGDKIRGLGFNDNINPADNSGVAFEETSDLLSYTNSYNMSSTFIENYFNEYGDFKGQQFGRKLTWTDSYTINREEGFIRVDNKICNEGDEIHLIYLSLPEKVTNQSVIHPFAESALLEYIGWQRSVYFREYNLIDYKRKEFYNANRILRARLNKLTTTEIKRAVRRNINLAVQN